MSGDYSRDNKRAGELRVMTPLSTLPKAMHLHGGDEIPEGLIGAKIVCGLEPCQNEILLRAAA